MRTDELFIYLPDREGYNNKYTGAFYAPIVIVFYHETSIPVSLTAEAVAQHLASPHPSCTRSAHLLKFVLETCARAHPQQAPHHPTCLLLTQPPSLFPQPPGLSLHQPCYKLKANMLHTPNQRLGLGVLLPNFQPPQSSPATPATTAAWLLTHGTSPSLGARRYLPRDGQAVKAAKGHCHPRLPSHQLGLQLPATVDDHAIPAATSPKHKSSAAMHTCCKLATPCRQGLLQHSIRPTYLAAAHQRPAFLPAASYHCLPMPPTTAYLCHILLLSMAAYLSLQLPTYAA